MVQSIRLLIKVSIKVECVLSPQDKVTKAGGEGLITSSGQVKKFSQAAVRVGREPMKGAG